MPVFYNKFFDHLQFSLTFYRLIDRNQMSDSEFEDLGASTIMNEKLVLEVRKKDQTINELNNKLNSLQKQLIAIQSCRLDSQSQLEKKNVILKQMVVDNIRLSKRLTNQEEQIIRLKQELLATDRSIHETISSNVMERESLLKLNQELSQGLLKAQQILDEKSQEIKTLRLKLSEKDKFAENLSIKIVELQAKQRNLSSSLNHYQQSQPLHIKAVSDMQQKLTNQKQKSQSLIKEITELNQTIMELQQNHLQVHSKLSQQLVVKRQIADEETEEKNRLIIQMINLKQQLKQIEKEKHNFGMVIEKQNSEIDGLQSKVRSLTSQVNTNSLLIKSKRSQSQQQYLLTAKASQLVIKQWEIKCKKLQKQLDQCSQVLHYSIQQCEDMRAELKQLRTNHDKLSQKYLALSEDKKNIIKQLQTLKLENNQFHLTNHELAILIQQSSEQLAITRKQLSLQHQYYAKKAIQDLNDQSSYEFILMKIKEIVNNIETQINEFCDLKQQEKAYAIDKQKQVLLRGIKKILEQQKQHQIMKKDGDKVVKMKIKQNQSGQKIGRSFHGFNPFLN